MPARKINRLHSKNINNEIKTRIRLIRQLEKLIQEEVEEAILHDDIPYDSEGIPKASSVPPNVEKINLMQIEIQKNIKIINDLSGGEFFHYNDNDKYVDEEPCHLAPENLGTHKLSGVSVNIATLDENAPDGGIDDVMDTIGHEHAEREHPTSPEMGMENITEITTADNFKFHIKDGKVEFSRLMAYLKKNQENQKLMGDLYSPSGTGSLKPRRQGGYIRRTPADDEQEKFIKTMDKKLDAYLKKMGEQEKPKKLQWVDPISKCEKKEFEEVKKELAKAKQTIYEMHINGLANSPSTAQEDPFKGCDPVNICHKLLAKDVFKEFAKKHYKKNSTLPTSDVQVGKDFKGSKSYKRLQTKIDEAKNDYKSMLLGEREKAWNKWKKTLEGKQPYKLEMPTDSTWILIRQEVWDDMKIKKRKRGRPPS